MSNLNHIGAAFERLEVLNSGKWFNLMLGLDDLLERNCSFVKTISEQSVLKLVNSISQFFPHDS